MHSVRSFLVIWTCVSAVILGYAGVDWALNPQLERETHFSMQPDISRVGELAHWGGRLVTRGHTSLLVGNAILLGGLTALTLMTVVRRLRRPADGNEDSVVGRLSTP